MVDSVVAVMFHGPVAANTAAALSPLIAQSLGKQLPAGVCRLIAEYADTTRPLQLGVPVCISTDVAGYLIDQSRLPAVALCSAMRSLFLSQWLRPDLEHVLLVPRGWSHGSIQCDLIPA